jgi:hypothetical protein
VPIDAELTAVYYPVPAAARVGVGEVAASDEGMAIAWT